ncbi:hypothetical protein I4U23_011509 [Adineta vaga]|nr:hypothetical protein I4U23_011509 [Adineta vaga]
MHLLRRIKYYHQVCEKDSFLLSCFYDDDHFCLCTDFNHQRLANCFEFDQQNKFDCFGQSNCQHGVECIQDRWTCPQTSICICPACYFGSLCQFTSDGFGLSLDGILGYHIQPHIHITYQPSIVQISISFTVIMICAGLVNSLLMITTFKNEGP